MRYLLPLALLFFFSCKNEPKPAADTAAETALPAGFAEFYQRFHTDSVFQMEHITFPLEGLPHQADGETIAAKNYKWQADGWRMMRPVDWQMSEYQREIVPLSSSLVMERIANPKSGIGMVRRFAIIGGEWHLIYYAGLNRLK